MRLNHLQKLYPGMSSTQLMDIFTLNLSDDIDIVCFFKSPQNDIIGHTECLGTNLNLGSAIPVAEWFSGFDSKALEGRALFERTFRERKQLITSLLKAKSKSVSPLKVLLNYNPTINLNANGYCHAHVTFTVVNTSWMHQAEYKFVVRTVSTKMEDEILDSNKSLVWTGDGNILGMLMPQETHNFTLTAVLFSSGVYDISSWKITSKLSLLESIIGPKQLQSNDSVFTQTSSFPQYLHVI